MLIRARTKVSEADRGADTLRWSDRPAGKRALATSSETRPDEPLTVLLTGATTGLGLAIAKKLLATRHRLILTGRASSLDRFQGEGIVDSAHTWLRPLDVTSLEEARAVVDEADGHWGGIDVLINNAGVAYRSVVEHISVEAVRECMRVNFHAPMELIRLVLPGMRAKRRGRILNISSVGGMMAMPTMCLYSASKFALEGATEALWYEVRPWGINVSLIQPGFIHSGSFQRTRYTEKAAAASRDPNHPYYAHYTAMAGFIERLMNRARANPDDIAHVVLRTMERKHPPMRVPATIDAHLFSYLRRLLPRPLYHALLYRSLPHVQEWGK